MTDHYITYLLSGSFCDFNDEQSAMINNYLESNEEERALLSEDNYIYTIMHLIQISEIDEAFAVLKKAKSLFPDDMDVDAMEVMCMYYEPLGKEAEVVSLADKCLKKWDMPVMIFAKSLVLFRMRNFKEGDEEFERYLALYPTKDYEVFRLDLYLHATYFLSDIRFKDLENYENKELFRQYLHINFLLDKYLEKALNFPMEVRFLMFYAMQFFMVDKYTQVKRILEKVIDVDSFNKDAWRMMSEILVKEGEYAEAAEAFKYRIAINDEDQYNYYNCAKCYMKIHRWEEAISCCELQVKNHSALLADDKKLYGNLKNMHIDGLMKLERFEDALKMCEEALLIDSNNFQAIVQKGQCYHFLGENLEASKTFVLALEQKLDYEKNDYFALYETIGDIYVEMSEEDLKRAEKKRMLQNAILSYNKAMMHLNLLSKPLVLDAYELQIQNAICCLKIGRVYNFLDEDIMAIVYFQQANNLHSELPALQLLLTTTYFKMGLINEAFLHFKNIPTEDFEEFKEMVPGLEHIKNEYEKQQFKSHKKL